MLKTILIAAFLLFSQTLLFGQVKVTFKTGHVPALKTDRKAIFLAGDFNKWDPSDARWQMQLGNATGQYQLDISMPAGKYSFKVTKGSWESVECSAGGADVSNRDISILHDTTITMDIAGWKDDYPATPKKHTTSPNVHVISEKFDIPQLGRQRRIWIYLPADYATSHKKYPVIYMHDGQNLFDDYTSGYGEWGIDELLDKMPVKDACIVVGIDHGGDYRITEYDPYDSKYGKGRGNDYVDFLAKTLKPYIDKNYRTQKDARHTTVAGSSMGGLISAYAILKYPNVFGNAGIFSPSFWIAPDMYKYAQDSKLSNKNRLYFVCGDSEGDGMVADMQKMAELLQAKGINENNSPITIIIGAKHNEKQWNGDFPAFYSWAIKDINNEVITNLFIAKNTTIMNEEIKIKTDQAILDKAKGLNEVQSPVRAGLKTKEAIVANWLPRYTGRPLEEFGKYIILTNFSKYIQLFSQWHDNAPVMGLDKPMQSVTADGITIINFGMGSSVAATVMDLLTAINPKAIIFLGKCGSLKKKINVGELILPIAAIRGEGTSNDYMPAEVPALPAFALQKAISTTIRDFKRDYWTGTCYTTNRRVWEHDKVFKRLLKKLRASAVDMETATIFVTGFANKIPTGALLLVSDQPMIPEGVKTSESDSKVTEQFVETHLHIGIESLKQLINNGLTVRHLKF